MIRRMTNWYPISVHPVRPGVYNVSCRNIYQTGQWYSYWNGSEFRYYSHDPETSYQMRGEAGCGKDTLSWRGLTKKP